MTKNEIAALVLGATLMSAPMVMANEAAAKCAAGKCGAAKKANEKMLEGEAKEHGVKAADANGTVKVKAADAKCGGMKK